MIKINIVSSTKAMTVQNHKCPKDQLFDQNILIDLLLTQMLNRLIIKIKKVSRNNSIWFLKDTQNNNHLKRVISLLKLIE